MLVPQVQRGEPRVGLEPREEGGPRRRRCGCPRHPGPISSANVLVHALNSDAYRCDFSLQGLPRRWTKRRTASPPVSVVAAAAGSRERGDPPAAAAAASAQAMAMARRARRSWTGLRAHLGATAEAQRGTATQALTAPPPLRSPDERRTRCRSSRSSAQRLCGAHLHFALRTAAALAPRCSRVRD